MILKEGGGDGYCKLGHKVLSSILDTTINFG